MPIKSPREAEQKGKREKKVSESEGAGDDGLLTGWQMGEKLFAPLKKLEKNRASA